jgi:hypothetical protein
MYLHDLSRRPGWTIYIAQVCRALGLSDAVWVGARKELEAYGFYRAERRRSARGKWEWHHYMYRDPVAIHPGDETTILRKVGDGEIMDEKQGDKRSYTQQITTSRSSSARARGPAAGAAARLQQRGVKARRERPSGIVCFYQDDPEAAAAVEVEPAEEVREAVADEIAEGNEPVPGRVARRILRNRAARDAAARRLAVDAPPTPMPARGGAAAVARLSEIDLRGD